MTQKRNRSNIAANVILLGETIKQIREALEAAPDELNGVNTERAGWHVITSWFEDERGRWFDEWRFDLHTDCFVYHEGQPDEWNVMKEHVATIDGLCRTISHLSAKRWATPDVLREFVRIVAAYHMDDRDSSQHPDMDSQRWPSGNGTRMG